ncbi:hypothetical protein D3C79_657950 [compost metagenome]
MQQGLVEHPGQGADLLAQQAVGRTEVAGLVGDKALTGITPAALLEVTFGEQALAVVVAQHAVGVGDHLAAAVVVAVQRATAKRDGNGQCEVVEQRGGQVDMAVGAALDGWQLGLLWRQGKVEAPGRGQSHAIDAVGLVGSHHHQCVLEDALALKIVKKCPDCVIQVGDRCLFRCVEALEVLGRRRIGLVGAHSEQRQHPWLVLLLQLAHIAQGTFEEGAVILAPREVQVVLVGEPLLAMHRIETDVRHDAVLGHEAQARALQVVGGEAGLAQLRRQAGLVAFVLGQQFYALGRAVGQLVVIAAQHRIQATDGLVGVQHVVWGVHAALGPLAELGHQVVVETAVQRLAVRLQVGAWDAFQGNHQQVAGASRAGKQPLPMQVGLSQAAAGQRGEGLRAAHPAFDLALQVTDPGRHQLVGEVVLPPLVGIGR